MIFQQVGKGKLRETKLACLFRTLTAGKILFVPYHAMVVNE